MAPVECCDEFPHGICDGEPRDEADVPLDFLRADPVGTRVIGLFVGDVDRAVGQHAADLLGDLRDRQVLVAHVPGLAGDRFPRQG